MKLSILSDFEISIFNTQLDWNATHRSRWYWNIGRPTAASLFPLKRGGISSCLKGQQPGFSTKLIRLPLSYGGSLQFAASGCHSASHLLSILSFLALYTAKLSQLRLRFHTSILSPAYLYVYLF